MAYDGRHVRRSSLNRHGGIGEALRARIKPKAGSMQLITQKSVSIGCRCLPAENGRKIELVSHRHQRREYWVSDRQRGGDRTKWRAGPDGVRNPMNRPESCGTGRWFHLQADAGAAPTVRRQGHRHSKPERPAPGYGPIPRGGRRRRLQPVSRSPCPQVQQCRSPCPAPRWDAAACAAGRIAGGPHGQHADRPPRAAFCGPARLEACVAGETHWGVLTAWAR